MYRNLREYIERLEREGELIRVSVPVSTRFEIAEITDRRRQNLCAAWRCSLAKGYAVGEDEDAALVG